MRICTTIVAMFAISILCFGCERSTEERQLKNFISAHVGKVKPVAKQVRLAYWRAANTGDAADYDQSSRLELQIRQIYTDSQEFAFLKGLKQSSRIKDAELARQLDVLYSSYLANQIDPRLLKEIVELGTEIEKNFSIFRGTIEGRKVTVNEIKEILKTETDSSKRKQAWVASKQVGAVVADDLIELVKLRNRSARQVGFENFHTLSLTLSELDIDELDRIFNELYELTDEPFRKLKGELDDILADKYAVEADGLMPWHYHDPFFQETPLVYELNLDTYYEDEDVGELAIKFYNGIALGVDSIIANSDLYEREGKNPHAFCTDIDKEGDVRILCNLKNNENWMETMLHELGHGVYDKYHDINVPYLLREPAHIFTTEAIAMLFGRLSRNGAWMQQMLGLSQVERAKIDQLSDKYARLKQLIFVRWAMVMYNFEKQLYANPEQDLNSLWWRMVARYQFVNKPPGREEPDWASKIHFTIAPCYYHNYVLGELLASQLHYYIVFNVLELQFDKDVSYVGHSKAGDFLRRKIFEPGSLYRWDDMIEQATGQPLTPKYFVDEFVK